MAAYDPTAFIGQKAEKLLKLAKENGEEIAVEMITLNLKLSYEEGYRRGFNDGLSKRQPTSRGKTP